MPERVHPEVAQRDPQLQRAAAARQLHAQVGEVHLAIDGLGALQVAGVDLERAPQAVSVAHQQGAHLDRLVQPLVRVERDRVGQLHAGQRRAPSLRQAGEGAVGAVHVQPGVVLAADPRQLGERVDRTHRRAARVGDDQQRAPAGGQVGADRALQRVRAHAPDVVAQDHPHLVGAEPQHARGAGQRRVRLVGHVQHCARVHLPHQRLAGAGERRQVRGRPTRDQCAARLGRIADPLPEPVEHGQLQRGRAGGAQPPAGIDVERARDQISQRPRPGALAGDVGEVAGMGETGDVGQHIALEVVQDLVEPRGPLGRRHRQAPVQLAGRLGVHHRARRPRDAIHQHVDRAISQLPHDVGIECERRSLVRRIGWHGRYSQVFSVAWLSVVCSINASPVGGRADRFSPERRL